jgi:hypothetical protein
MTTTATEQTMFTHSQRAPRINPIDLAKDQIIAAFNRVIYDWQHQREWQAFELSEEFTHDKSEAESRPGLPWMMDSLKDRIRAHYQRQGKRVQVIWQAARSPEDTGATYTLFVKLR